MAENRVITLRLKPTFYQMSGSSNYLVLSDQAAGWDHTLEKPTVNAVGRVNAYFSSTSNGTTVVEDIGNGSVRLTNFLQTTISVANGFSLRSAWLGTAGSPAQASYIDDFDGSIELFDNETINVNIVMEAIVHRSDIVYSELTYNSAGDKVKIAVFPWERWKVNSLGRQDVADGTISASVPGISAMNLADSIDYLFANGTALMRGNLFSMNVNPVIRKQETMQDPIRETDIACSTSAQNVARKIKIIWAGRHVVVFDRQVDLPIGQTLQLVLREVVNLKQKAT